MRKVIYILVGIFLILLVLYGVFNVVSKKAAGLYVETTPEASVFINGEQLENTPFESTFDPGEYDVKLEPIGIQAHAFESRINLVSGVRTVIKHKFSQDYSLSSSVILSFKKEAGNTTALAVVSEPSSAEVYLDGNFLGYTPLKSTNITEGNHSLLIGKEDYLVEAVDISTIEGYTLTITTKLSADPVNVQEEAKEVVVSKQEYVVILPTGTGFLRIRQDPDINSPELTRVEPGEQYKLITRDSGTGWHKIEYASGKNGYVSSEFTEITEYSNNDEN